MKTFNQVIDIEILDNLMYENNFKMIITMYLIIFKKINELKYLTEDYSFEVIRYGIYNDYPAIGVQYKRNDIDYYKVSENLDQMVNDIFVKLVNNFTLMEFIDFAFIFVFFQGYLLSIE